MALVKCPECAAEVSDSAMECPKCGVQIKKPKRGVFGKLVLWAFYGFNVVMLIWMISGISGADVSSGDEWEQAGAAIGTAMGAGLIAAIWVAGDVILGLFVLITRPKRS